MFYKHRILLVDALLVPDESPLPPLGERAGYSRSSLLIDTITTRDYLGRPGKA